MLRIMEHWAERHTVISMTLLHVAVGIGFLGAVSAITVVGGAVIWSAYRFAGIM